MATEQLQVQWAPAATIYFALVDPSGNYRDFAEPWAVGATNLFKAINSQPVNGVTTGGAGAGAFRVAGNITASLTVGNHIRVRGSTGNDGIYTVRSGSAFAGGNTTINVNEAVSNGTANGTVDLVATPAIAATEHNPGGSAAKSIYNGSVDLATVHTSGDVAQYSVLAFVQATAFAIPGSDQVTGPPAALDVQFGFKGPGDLSLEVNAAFTSTAGTEVRTTACLLRNGARVPLETYAPTSTLALAVREWGAGVDLFTVAATTINTTNGDFELTKASPGYTADRTYRYRFTLVENGNTWVFDRVMPNHG